jgi:hypothetical protein
VASLVVPLENHMGRPAVSQVYAWRFKPMRDQHTAFHKRGFDATGASAQAAPGGAAPAAPEHRS